MVERSDVKGWLREYAIVFVLWTAVALCSGLADYAFLRSVGASPAWVSVFRRPLTEQWIWAALTPAVFHLARRFPLARRHFWRLFSLHIVFFVALSALHCVIADAVGGPLASLPRGYQGSRLWLRFLEEIYSDVWMYWPLVCIRALVDAQARERERERRARRLEQALSSTRLSLLRAQIQPHFLFNTLHAVVALLRVDARAAEDMLADLSDLLRASFADGSTQEAPLRDELELVRCYLRIQQRRLGDRLTVDWRVAPETLDAALPVLVLQSLVENAVVHGIAVLARPARLEIAARREGDRLQLVVRDDGAGIAPGTHPGIGLDNTRERLQQLYGDAQSFELASGPGQGTYATLTLPWRLLPPLTRSADDEDQNADRGRRAAGTAEPLVAP